MKRSEPTTTLDSRDAGFRSVSGGPELASGPTLLVEAYVAIWLVLFAFILLGWRRVTKVDTRIAELERLVHRHPGEAERAAGGGAR